MSNSYSKQKGYRGEHLFVQMCNEAGILAERLQYSDERGDVRLDGGIVEVKNRKNRYKSVLDWLDKSQGILALKYQGKEKYAVVLSWEKWVDLTKKAKCAIMKPSTKGWGEL